MFGFRSKPQVKAADMKAGMCVRVGTKTVRLVEDPMPDEEHPEHPLGMRVRMPDGNALATIYMTPEMEFELVASRLVPVEVEHDSVRHYVAAESIAQAIELVRANDPDHAEWDTLEAEIVAPERAANLTIFDEDSRERPTLARLVDCAAEPTPLACSEY